MSALYQLSCLGAGDLLEYTLLRQVSQKDARNHGPGNHDLYGVCVERPGMLTNQYVCNPEQNWFQAQPYRDQIDREQQAYSGHQCVITYQATRTRPSRLLLSVRGTGTLYSHYLYYVLALALFIITIIRDV